MPNMNQNFLRILKDAFIKCLKSSPRSNEKLKVLHPAIAKDISACFNDSQYEVNSLSENSKHEKIIAGRYLDKRVDITVCLNDKPIAGIAVKFVMSNYSQNSNNYFENMLGETANIRSANIPYFQIFCIFDKIPYFDKSGEITKWEEITFHNLDKYIQLSQDNIDCFYHTPNKTLICVAHISAPQQNKIHNRETYKDYYCNTQFNLTFSTKNFEFGKAVIYNDYATFINKIVYAIKSI